MIATPSIWLIQYIFPCVSREDEVTSEYSQKRSLSWEHVTKCCQKCIVNNFVKYTNSWVRICSGTTKKSHSLGIRNWGWVYLKSTYSLESIYVPFSYGQNWKGSHKIRSNVDNASEKWCKKLEVRTFVVRGLTHPFCLSASTEGYSSSTLKV